MVSGGHSKLAKRKVSEQTERRPYRYLSPPRSSCRAPVEDLQTPDKGLRISRIEGRSDPHSSTWPTGHQSSFRKQTPPTRSFVKCNSRKQMRRWRNCHQWSTKDHPRAYKIEKVKPTCIAVLTAPHTAPAIGLPVFPTMTSTTTVNPLTESRKVVKRGPHRRLLRLAFWRSISHVSAITSLDAGGDVWRKDFFWSSDKIAS